MAFSPALVNSKILVWNHQAWHKFIGGRVCKPKSSFFPVARVKRPHFIFTSDRECDRLQLSILFYSHHLGDYLKDTRTLSMLEHGAYRLLMDYYYSHGGPIPDDLKNISRACLATTPNERRAVEKVLLKYFTRENGIWCHRRMDEEIKKSRERSDIAKEKAAKRWNINMPQHVPEQCKPLAISHKPIASCENEEVCRKEELPSAWCDYAEGRNIPNDQIYVSWTKFKAVTSHPFKLSNWKKWVDRERVKQRHG